MRLLGFNLGLVFVPGTAAPRIRSDGRGALVVFPFGVGLVFLGSREGLAEGGRTKSDGGERDPLDLGFAFGSSGSPESKRGIAGHLLGGLELRGTAERPVAPLALPSPYPSGEPIRADGRRVAVRLGASGSAIAGTPG